MRKSFLLPIVLALVLFPVLSFSKIELPLPGITPDSIYYPLDVFAEKVVLFFTFSSEQKIVKALRYAEEKLAEINKMIDEGKTGFAEKASANYKEYLILANTEIQNLEYKEDQETQAGSVADRIIEHEDVLLGIWEGASKENRDKIEQIISFSKEQFEKTIEILPQNIKEDLEQKQEEINSALLELKGDEGEQEQKEEETQEPEKENETLIFSSDEKDNLKECKDLESSDVFSITRCYKELGNQFVNLELCNQAGDIVGLGSCYGGFAQATSSVDFCNQFVEIPSEGASTISLATCYGVFAQLEENPKICDKAPSFKSKVGCYLLIAGLEKDIEICENIIEGKEGCYIIVAVEKRDLTVCNEIEDNELRGLCVLSVATERMTKEELCKIGEALELFTEQDCLEHFQRK